MKFFRSIILILLLASCGNQKIRFQRVQTHKQTIVKVDNDARPIQSEKKVGFKDGEVHSELITTEIPAFSNGEVIAQRNEVIIGQPKKITSESKKQPLTDEEKVEIALEAEKNAKSASALLIGAFFGFFAFIVPGVVLFILGTIYYFRTRNSQYISEKGQRAFELARVFYFIDFALIAALVVGIIALIIGNFL